MQTIAALIALGIVLYAVISLAGIKTRLDRLVELNERIANGLVRDHVEEPDLPESEAQRLRAEYADRSAEDLGRLLAGEGLRPGVAKVIREELIRRG